MRKRRKVKKRALILLAIVSIVIIVVVMASYQGEQGEQGPPGPTAEEYFEIFGASVDWPSELRENDTVLVIKYLYFNVKAVGGDAHEVTVNHKGYYFANYVELGNMTRGEVRWVELLIPDPGFRTTLEEEGFPIAIPIFSEEAWGDITVYIPYP